MIKMKMNNVKYRRIFKFATLLFTSMLIAAVSAQTYKYMYIDGSVTVQTGVGLKWVAGSDAPSGTSIAGSTVTLPLTVQNGTPINFTYCLYLQNLDNSNHALVIDVTDAATASNYTEFNLILRINSTGALIDTLVVTTTDSYSGTITNLAVWRLTFEVAATSTASGSDTFDLQFRYE